MTATTIRVQMAQRKDTAANWTAANPILLSGEIGYETDTKKFKIGDGTTNWNSLAYLPIPDGSGNLTITGNLEIGNTGSLTFEGSTADGFETTLAVTNPTADRTITLPDRSGTVITSGDTGTVTSTMLADGTIVDADVNTSAAIAGTKISPDFGSQTIQTTGIFSHALGTAGAPTVTFTGDTNTGLYSPGADQVAISTAGSGRLFINSAGDVGLNTASPLSIGVAGMPALTLASSTAGRSGGLYWADTGSTNIASAYWFGTEFGLGTETAHPIKLITNGTEKLRITSAGLVGVGTSTPESSLHVSGAAKVSSGADSGGYQVRYSGANSSSRSWRLTNDINAYGDFDIQQSTTQTGSTFASRLYISASGSVGVGTTSPARPLDVNGSVRLSSGSVIEFGGTVTNFITGDNSSNYLAFGTNSSERARIDSSGRLLVGTSSAPTLGSYNQFGKLIVQGNTFSSATTAVVSLNRGESAAGITTGEELGVIAFGDSDGGTFGTIQCVADAAAGVSDFPGRLVFSTTADGASSPTERMRIASGGAIILGPGSPSTNATLTIYPNDSNGAALADWNRADTANTSTAARFRNNATTVGSISYTNTATAYNTSSDYRLKENVVAVTDGITRLQQLKPSRFNFIVDPDTVVDGFLAHEVQTVVPEAITGTKDAVDDDGNPVYQGIDQSKLVPLLTAALQEAVAKIESLEARLTAADI